MMAGIKAKNTKPELFLRSALHAQGFRYRLGGCGLPGRPDLVFPGRRVAVFVHGCFWHHHDCRYFKWPATNIQAWRVKIDSNVQRDRRVVTDLERLGWTVIVVWECELTKASEPESRRTVSRVVRVLRQQCCRIPAHEVSTSTLPHGPRRSLVEGRRGVSRRKNSGG